ncbi:40S ribosomal protein S19 [Candidatus Pacearchaeota archaeon]|nr:40S ribosomal protein S19 [Candidatus Pacearchaeota archaeon]
MVYEINPREFNGKLAEALKKIPEFKQPEWAKFVKTGASKERPPEDSDFWHKRAASILRQIYQRKNIGVSRLRTKYGSKKNRGVRPEEFRKAGGKIIRVILQQADKAGFTEIAKLIKGIKGRRLGRQLTKKGIEFLEGIK